MEDVKKIEAFLAVDRGYGSGHGSGHGSGYGYGDGYGYGSGHGYGYGDGYGSGYGDGYGIKSINGETVYQIDGVATMLDRIHDNVAKGRILQSDLSFTPCYVVKQGATFAHGENLRKAMEALTSKLMEGMSEEERIEAFVKTHPEDKPYPNEELFEWHHRLTGSCEAGRKAFIADRGLTLDGETTVSEFIALTENAYGGRVIRMLKEHYPQTHKEAE